jgi:hypothetical protein
LCFCQLILFFKGRGGEGDDVQGFLFLFFVVHVNMLKTF